MASKMIGRPSLLAPLVQTHTHINPQKWVKNKCVSKCLNSPKTNNAMKIFFRGGDIFDTWENWLGLIVTIDKLKNMFFKGNHIISRASRQQTLFLIYFQGNKISWYFLIFPLSTKYPSASGTFCLFVKLFESRWLSSMFFVLVMLLQYFKTTSQCTWFCWSKRSFHDTEIIIMSRISLMLVLITTFSVCSTEDQRKDFEILI